NAECTAEEVVLHGELIANGEVGRAAEGTPLENRDAAALRQRVIDDGEVFVEGEELEGGGVIESPAAAIAGPPDGAEFGAPEFETRSSLNVAEELAGLAEHARALLIGGGIEERAGEHGQDVGA